ncbi:MAG: Druantia anti-phage system protein DruA, partial [Bacteroidota bacterium]
MVTQPELLRQRILDSLRSQGFAVNDGQLVPFTEGDKTAIRQLHRQACLTKIEQAKTALACHERWLLKYFACGTEVIPERICPVLHEVKPDTEEELLFRYARLHWSVPVSAGYGRRLRFLVMDDHNGKLIGLFGLGDPVFRLGPRDAWIGWDVSSRRERLRYVMDAFVLGAVPPYSHLLCGKLMATLIA